MPLVLAPGSGYLVIDHTNDIELKVCSELVVDLRERKLRQRSASEHDSRPEWDA